MRDFPKAFAVTLGLTVVLITAWAACGANSEKIPPGWTDVKKVSFAIVDALFVKHLDAVNATFDQGDNKYRGVVITMEITKPAGEQITLEACDFTLHYRYGDGSDVAPCKGISAFSTDTGVDRPMQLSSVGRVSSTSGTATTKDDSIYVDLFFDGMESTTSELYILYATPVTSGFETSGWEE